MKLKAILLMIVTLGLLTGCSQSGESGSDNAKHYRNPNEEKKGNNAGGQKGQGDASGQADGPAGGKADNNSGGPAPNMANSSGSDDTQTTKHQPGMSANDSKSQDQKQGSNDAPPR
jgi:hypothetical protein